MTDDRARTDADELHRDRTVWTTILILGVLVAAGALALGWRVVEGRLEAAKSLDRAMTVLKATDQAIATADEVVRAPANPATTAKARAAKLRMQDARKQLAEARALAGAGIERLTDDEQEQAHLVESAATARIELLDAAAGVLSAMEKAAAAESLADQAWAKALAADRLARQSVTDYNKLKRADVKSAVEANVGAKAGFIEARELLSQAASTYPEAKLDAHVDYLDRRLALVALSRKAENTWLSGRITQANKLIASYNKKDAAAAAAAKRLPGSPVSSVAEAYQATVESATSTYFRARQKAAEADSALRML